MDDEHEAKPTDKEPADHHQRWPEFRGWQTLLFVLSILSWSHKTGLYLLVDKILEVKGKVRRTIILLTFPWLAFLLFVADIHLVSLLPFQLVLQRVLREIFREHITCTHFQQTDSSTHREKCQLHTKRTADKDITEYKGVLDVRKETRSRKNRQLSKERIKIIIYI